MGKSKGFRMEKGECVDQKQGLIDLTALRLSELFRIYVERKR